MKLRTLAGSACWLLILGCGGGVEQDANAGEPAEAVAVVDDGTALTELVSYYETHYNMHHAPVVADLYADEAAFLAANGSIADGKAEITTYLEEAMAAMSPQLAVTQADRIIEGNNAVLRGTYTLTGEVEGEAVGFSGSFMNVLRKEGDDWKLVHTQTNYDTETSADQWQDMGDDAEAPPEESILGTLLENYETHYNLGHASMVADFYSENAAASFGGSPWVSGREAIAEAVQAGMDARGDGQLDAHGVASTDLGGGLVADAGWYEVTEGDERVQYGTYTLLAEQTPDGEYVIRWLVSNTSPTS